MDHSKWTPNKSKLNCDSFVMLSPITKTPVRNNSVRLMSSFQSSTSNFSVLPNHITPPPSGLTKFIARNPFEADLTNKLHISVISPSVFSKVASPAQKGSPVFTWSIDELANMQPAKIDEFPIQQMHCSDPEIERTAQEAISRFFSENQIIPSPHESKRLQSEKKLELCTPIKHDEDADMSRESHKAKKAKRDSWTQTVLSLPPELPPNVEEALKPYFNFTQDQNCEPKTANCEEANTSNSSLRRKLFANHNDSHDESNSSISISPVKPTSPLIHNLSPAQSGMFFHGTPLRNCSQIIQRTYGTPRTYGRDSSPCDVSPISNGGLNMSCQSIQSKNSSIAKLDFTKDMSIEVSILEESKGSRKSPINTSICKTLFSEDMNLEEKENSQSHLEDEKYSDVTQMIVSTNNSIKIKNEDKENFALNNFNVINKSRLDFCKTNISESYVMQQSSMLSGNYVQRMASKYEDKENLAPNNFNVTSKSKLDFCKTSVSESYAMQQSSMLSGNYVQQMAFSSAQDTGYQTYNGSNITNNIDSYSSSIKLKLNWDERIVQADEEVQLSDWKENIKNVISSTPSKYNRAMSNL